MFCASEGEVGVQRTQESNRSADELLNQACREYSKDATNEDCNLDFRVFPLDREHQKRISGANAVVSTLNEFKVRRTVEIPELEQFVCIRWVCIS